MSRSEQLIRQHITAAINSRRITIMEAARSISNLIMEDHPNKQLALDIGAKMIAEKNALSSCA